MKYFNKLKTKYKVTAIGLAIIIALGFSAAFAVNAQGVAKDKSYGVNGVSVPSHLMNILKHVDAIRDKATAGDAEAQYKLGLYYFKGMMIGQDIEKAVKWLFLSHSQGNLHASNALGEVYAQYGGGGAKSLISAFRYFKVAADGGLMIGQINLGVRYYKGHGVRKDFNKALAMFNKAAHQGSHTAEYYIGIMYQKGQGIKIDPVKALVWYIRAANNGNQYGAYNAGLYHERGFGVPVAKTVALKYYKMSAELGNANAQFKVGNMYYLGIGTPRDLESAFVYLMAAQLQKHEDATKAVKLIMPKMTVAQVRSAGLRIDKIVDAKINRRWF